MTIALFPHGDITCCILKRNQEIKLRVIGVNLVVELNSKKSSVLVSITVRRRRAGGDQASEGTHRVGTTWPTGGRLADSAHGGSQAAAVPVPIVEHQALVRHPPAQAFGPAIWW
jgi:hypothetical protein